MFQNEVQINLWSVNMTMKHKNMQSDVNEWTPSSVKRELFITHSRFRGRMKMNTPSFQHTTL